MTVYYCAGRRAVYVIKVLCGCDYINLAYVTITKVI